MNHQTEQSQSEKARVPLGFGNLHASVGDHIGHFYQDSEEEKNVLSSFIRAGLENGERCVCIISPDQTREKLQDGLSASGIDMEEVISSDQLLLSEGTGDSQELRALLKEEFEKIPDQYPLLRWAGNMSWALKKVPTTEKLMEFEAYCNVIAKPPAIFLCQYELPVFCGTVVMDAMKTHPLCMVSNVIHQNQYYEQPETYLENLRRREPTALA